MLDSDRDQLSEIFEALEWLYLQNLIYFYDDPLSEGARKSSAEGGLFERDPGSIFKGAEIVDLRD
jgi:hypothetical protein